MSHHQHNARAVYKANKVHSYIAGMNLKSRSNLKRIARKVDSSQATKEFRIKQASYDQDVARKNKVKFAARKERAEKRAADIQKTIVILDPTRIDSLGVKELNKQFKWHRAQGTVEHDGNHVIDC
ncbi:hypothetical protein PM082_024485 [Marasmius tenuissimus]|nr:hypothetical protein PM082_024485 [Marasmius tenuissimus]